MSEFEPDSITPDDEPQTEAGEVAVEEQPSETAAEGAECAPAGPRWKRVVKRLGIGIGVTIVFLVFAAVMLYNFGGMWVRTPEMKTAFNELVASGAAEPVEYRFTIPIPGCTCHSDDPVLQAKHSVRHVSQCMKCHNTDPAHEEPGL